MNEQLKKQVEAFQILDKFINSESYSFYRFLSQRRIVVSIFRSNYSELLKSYSFHNNQNRHERFWDQVSFRYRQRIQLNLVRLISNYLGSLSALIDFTRTNITPQLKTNDKIYNEFENLKKEYLLSVESHKFVQELRNFTTHNSALSISSEISHTNQSETVVDIFIKKSDILKWSGWSSQSLSFIEKENEKIYLIRILKNHFDRFTQFQNSVFLLLFLINPEKTLLFQSELTKTYNQIHPYTKMQPLTRGYIRYISMVLGKANRITKQLPQSGQIVMT